MKSELSFLMDLFLSDEVPVPIKKLVAERIREVEEEFVSKVPRLSNSPGHANLVVPMQAPSMQRIMAEHPEIPVVTTQAPVTTAAAEALQRRAAIIQGALNGNDKPEPSRTSPRKF